MKKYFGLSFIVSILYSGRAGGYNIENDIDYSGAGYETIFFTLIFFILLYLLSKIESLEFNDELTISIWVFIVIIVSGAITALATNNKLLIQLFIITPLIVSSYIYLYMSYDSWKERTRGHLESSVATDSWIPSVIGYLIVAFFLHFPFYLLIKWVIGKSTANASWYFIYPASFILLLYFRRSGYQKKIPTETNIDLNPSISFKNLVSNTTSLRLSIIVKFVFFVLIVMFGFSFDDYLSVFNASSEKKHSIKTEKPVWEELLSNPNSPDTVTPTGRETPISKPIDGYPDSTEPNSEANANLLKEQQDYIRVATQIVAIHPELAEDGPASDKVLELVELYKSKGYKAADSLQMAVNQIYSETKVVSDSKVKHYKNAKSNEPSKICEYKAVMTDEDYGLCGLTPPKP